MDNIRVLLLYKIKYTSMNIGYFVVLQNLIRFMTLKNILVQKSIKK
ncbi:hypothetical protein JM81_0046 [Maribacter sp. MAR_2009_72]|nr:hypothetical protein JM81_0046 [Maribacter sp. MAR_2009_72]